MLVTGILVIGGVFVFTKINQSVKPEVVVDDTTNDKYPGDISQPPLPEVKARDWDTVGTYHNPVYSYTVEYPATNFSINPEDVSAKDPSNIVFGDNTGSRSIVIASYTTKVTDPYQMLGRYKNQFVFEKEITIDGYPAVVAHWIWDDGKEFPDAKAVLFIKDGYEYEIRTEYVDHERIWKSFRFDT